MDPHTIAIPDQCPPVKMNPGEKLIINFHQTVFMWNSDPDEFSPTLEIDIYRKGDQRVVTAQSKVETVQYGWLALVPDSENALCRSAGREGVEGGSGGHTIQVGEGPLDLIKLQQYLESDKDLCKCWPCVAPLIELMLKKPLPRGIEHFLKALLEAGNTVCSKQK